MLANYLRCYNKFYHVQETRSSAHLRCRFAHHQPKLTVMLTEKPQHPYED